MVAAVEVVREDHVYFGNDGVARSGTVALQMTTAWDGLMPLSRNSAFSAEGAQILKT